MQTDHYFWEVTAYYPTRRGTTYRMTKQFSTLKDAWAWTERLSTDRVVYTMTSHNEEL